MSETFDQIREFILGNIGLVIFLVFALSSLIGRGNKGKQQKPQPQQQSQPTAAHDDRPLAERLAEYFGVEIPEEQKRPSVPQQPTKQPTYASEGRRSTISKNVQDQYPELFGGPGMFDSASEYGADKTKYGFDDTEWGSTFEKSEEQWGNSFPDRKSSEPRIEWPN